MQGVTPTRTARTDRLARRTRLVRRSAVLAAVAVLGCAGPSWADVSISKSSGADDGNTTISAQAQGVKYSYPSGKPASGGKALASSDASWTPPPCWIAPIADPKTFKQMVLKQVKETDVPGQADYAMQAMDEYQRHYAKGYTWSGGGDGYKNYNLDKEGKGMFWGPVENPDSDSPHRFDCNGTLPFWVDNGDLPPAGTPNVITPEMLAKLALQQTRVPGVTVQVNPVGDSTVNLPTWVWLRERYRPVSVRASVDLGGGRQIWAQTTATPASVHIDPGTPDATVYPASGDCPIAANGQVGAAYDGHSTAAPPCGVTYRRSTDTVGPFDLNVAATWNVSWTGSDGGPHQLPQGRVTDERQVTVQEIESVNR